LANDSTTPLSRKAEPAVERQHRVLAVPAGRSHQRLGSAAVAVGKEPRKRHGLVLLEHDDAGVERADARPGRRIRAGRDGTRIELGAALDVRDLEAAGEEEVAALLVVRRRTPCPRYPASLRRSRSRSTAGFYASLTRGRLRMG
jgi:hypothetical protein